MTGVLSAQLSLLALLACLAETCTLAESHACVTN